MTKLHDNLQRRTAFEETQARTAEYEADVLARYEARKASLIKLRPNKDFKVYLEIEEEMNNPDIVIAYKCSDAVCEGLKKGIRDFRKRRRLLEKVQEANGQAPRR